MADDEFNSQTDAKKMRIFTERDFILLLINLYRDSPELWQTKCIHYLNKAKRSEALKRIVEQLKPYRPDFDEEKLKRKINVLRTNFNKEYHKYEWRKRSGLPIEEVPKPLLWYYDHLSFVKEQSQDQDMENNETKQENVSDYTFMLDPLETSPSQTPPPTTSDYRKISINHHKSSSSREISHEGYDEYDHFGLMIAHKIRNIDDFYEREKLMNAIQNFVFREITKMK